LLHFISSQTKIKNIKIEIKSEHVNLEKVMASVSGKEVKASSAYRTKPENNNYKSKWQTKLGIAEGVTK